MQGGREGGIPPSSPGQGVRAAPATRGAVGWGAHRLQKQQLALMFQKRIALHWNQFVLPPPKSRANSRVCSWEVGLNCGGTAEHRPALVTPWGLEIDTENVARPDQGTDSYLWPWPQPLAVPEGAEAPPPPPPRSAGTGSQGAFLSSELPGYASVTTVTLRNLILFFLF